MISAHAAHMEAAELYRATYADTRDYLLYVSRPSPTEPTRYVWTSGVRLGLAASAAHLTRLLAERQQVSHDPEWAPCQVCQRPVRRDSLGRRSSHNHY